MTDAGSELANVTLSIVSNNTALPFGMLNIYLHEKHVLLEEEVDFTTEVSHMKGASGVNTHSRVFVTGKNDQAVNDLDKYMRQTTDPNLLRVARKEQKRKGLSLFINSKACFNVTRLMPIQDLMKEW